MAPLAAPEGGGVSSKGIVEPWASGSALREARISTSEARAGERIVGVHIDEHSLRADLADGRTITAPLAWFPRLLHATPEQRAAWEFCAGGHGIHWPMIDEDVSAAGLLRGAP